jgi:hypothetical protein
MMEKPNVTRENVYFLNTHKHNIHQENFIFGKLKEEFGIKSPLQNTKITV